MDMRQAKIREHAGRRRRPVTTAARPATHRPGGCQCRSRGGQGRERESRHPPTHHAPVSTPRPVSLSYSCASSSGHVRWVSLMLDPSFERGDRPTICTQPLRHLRKIKDLLSLGPRSWSSVPRATSAATWCFACCVRAGACESASHFTVMACWHPKGVWGLLYRSALVPAPLFIFKGMTANMARLGDGARRAPQRRRSLTWVKPGTGCGPIVRGVPARWGLVCLDASVAP